MGDVSRIITPDNLGGGRQLRSDESGLVYLTQEMEDSGEWLDQGEWAPEFEPALFILFNSQVDITFDPTMSADRSRQVTQDQARVLDGDWGRWRVRLNYAPRWERRIPPWHMAVYFNGNEMGILSPLMEMRTCWRCGVTGWHEISAEHRLRTGSQVRRVPRCVPRQPCIGRPSSVAGGRVLSWQNCGAMDWWGHLAEHGCVTRQQFQLDAAQHLARMENEDSFASEMATDYVDGKPQLIRPTELMTKN